MKLTLHFVRKALLAATLYLKIVYNTAKQKILGPQEIIVTLYYSQGLKVFPQRRNFHRLSCTLMSSRNFTLANTFLCFWIHLKDEFYLFHSIIFLCIFKVQRFKKLHFFFFFLQSLGKVTTLTCMKNDIIKNW